MDTIPLIDLKAQYSLLKDDIMIRMNTVLEHGRYIMGPEVLELEEKLSVFSGATHAIGVSNGTDALMMVLMGENVGAGDAVFIPSFTFTATAEVVLLLGATPVFVDVDERNFNIDIADLEMKIKDVLSKGILTPRVVMPVDLFGLPVDYDALFSVTSKYDLFVLADAAQAFGGAYKGKKVGSLCDATTTSFFPAKPLGCFGDGGAIFTNDDEKAAIYRSIRAHGKGGAKYDIIRVGLNARLDTIQAAVLLSKMTVFADEIQARNKIANRYNEALGDHVVVPTNPYGGNVDCVSAWAQYSILVDERDELAAALKGEGIPTAIYYPLPMHMQSAYRKYGTGEGMLPVSEGLSKKILSLPMHPYLDEKTQDYICSQIKKFCT